MLKFKDFMDLSEEELNEISLTQRIARSFLMRKLKGVLKAGARRFKGRLPDKKRALKRANRTARAAAFKVLSRGKDKGSMSNAQKSSIEKKLNKPAMQGRLKRAVKRILPQKRMGR